MEADGSRRGGEGQPIGQGLLLGLVLCREARAVPRGVELVMVRNWCSTPRVTFLQECRSPGIAVKVWIWATADVLVPVTTIVLRV